MHQRLKATTVYVTHDQIEAMTLADRVVVMNGGRIEQDRIAARMLREAAILFVATFIGSPPMNFLEGDLLKGTILHLADGTRLNLPAGDSKQRSRVTIGIRPEHFTVAPSGWPATVSVVEPTGSETQITARFAGHVVRVLSRGRTSVRPGDTIHLAFDPAHLHFFDPAPVPEVAKIENIS